LLIPGFGASSQSKVYSKMRNVFSDQYNLIVIQCDYFGHSHMQNNMDNSVSLNNDFLNKYFTAQEIRFIKEGEVWNNFVSICKEKGFERVPVVYRPRESLEDFSDMGLMQAIDNLTALFYVINILNDNNLNFNRNRILVYGHSHGAYLGLLCNALQPDLFDMIIDNSGWVYPTFMTKYRVRNLPSDSLQVTAYYDYLAPKINMDHEFLDLRNIYRQVNNRAYIQSFLGESDHLVSLEQKQSLCEMIPNCQFQFITPDKVDGVMFKSTKHGLDADFLKVFDYSYSRLQSHSRKKCLYANNRIRTQRHQYDIYFDSGIPLIKISDNDRLFSENSQLIKNNLD